MGELGEHCMYVNRVIIRPLTWNLSVIERENPYYLESDRLLLFHDETEQLLGLVS